MTDQPDPVRRLLDGCNAIDHHLLRVGGPADWEPRTWDTGRVARTDGRHIADAFTQPLQDYIAAFDPETITHIRAALVDIAQAIHEDNAHIPGLDHLLTAADTLTATTQPGWHKRGY